MYYFFNNKGFYYKRSYLTIPDLLAKCSLILQIIQGFVILLYYFYAKRKFEGFLCNRLIYIEDEFGINTYNKKYNLELDKKNFKEFFKKKKIWIIK